MAKTQADKIVETFKSLINMTPSELDHWLKTQQSQSVGAHKEEHTAKDKSVKEVATGHESGRIIKQILQKDSTDLTVKEVSHMERTIQFIKQQLGKQPSNEDLATSRWRYGLMNWGHDPLNN